DARRLGRHRGSERRSRFRAAGGGRSAAPSNVRLRALRHRRGAVRRPGAGVRHRRRRRGRHLRRHPGPAAHRCHRSHGERHRRRAWLPGRGLHEAV
ncbi:MAG: hypothetical protein AVDCRST_MAG89-198, partial [uncultured Gemmatimonadetes bacterium]